jgi:ABC-type glycerol-3-phosphate transport system permease component
MKLKRGIYWFFIYFFCVVIVIFALVPFLWTVSTSFKPEVTTLVRNPTFIPNPFTMGNYLAVLKDRNMMNYYRNTVLVAILSTGVSVFVAIFAAYGFSRYKFPGRTTLLYSIMFTRILPRVTLLVPFFVILSKIRLVNTYAGLILIYLVIGMPVTIWLLKGYIDNVPYEVEEAAVIDGCNPLQILFRIVIPMVAPAISAISMFAFILSWNEFLFPLVIAKDSKVRPISVGLAFYIDETGVQWGKLMAACVLMSIPAIIIFSFAQKYIVQGLSEGAVKS